MRQDTRHPTMTTMPRRLLKAMAVTLLIVTALYIAPELHARVLNSEHGRWTRRDPLGYVDGSNLYQTTRSNPIGLTDPHGRKPRGTLCPGEPCPSDPLYTPDLCCQIYGIRNPGVQGAYGYTICCFGALVNCYNDDGVDRDFGAWPDVARAIRACVRRCEPLHCPNFSCEDIGRDIDPPNNTPRQRACSECQVAFCGLQCLINACTNQHQLDPRMCVLCPEGDQECYDQVYRYLEQLRDFMLRNCISCFIETVEEILN